MYSVVRFLQKSELYRIVLCSITQHEIHANCTGVVWLVLLAVIMLNYHYIEYTGHVHKT